MKEIERVEIIKKKSRDLEDVTFKPHRFGTFVLFGVLGVTFAVSSGHNIGQSWFYVGLGAIISFICLKVSLTSYSKREEF